MDNSTNFLSNLKLDQLDWYKGIIAILMGFIGFIGSFYAIRFDFGDVNIIISWSLMFPLLITLAWGLRYGFISIILGLTVLYPFYPGSYNGWASLVPAFSLMVWIIIQGSGADRRFRGSSFYTNIYFLQSIYVIIRVMLYFTAFPFLYQFNPPFWNPNAHTTIDFETISVFAVKSVIIEFILLALCDVMLMMPFIKKVLRLKNSKLARYNTTIVLSLFVFGEFFALIILTVDYYILDPRHSFQWLLEPSSKILMTLLFTGILNLILGGIIARFMESRLEAEESLKQSEAKFRGLFESINDLFVEAALDGKIINVAPSATAILKYSAEELIGTNLALLYSRPEQRSDIIKILVREKEVKNYEITLKDKEGKDHYLWLHARVVDYNNEEQRIIGIARDVTDYVEAKRKQEESEERYRLLYNRMPNGFVTLDPVYDEKGKLVDLRFRTLNPGFEIQSNLLEKNLASKTWVELFNTPPQQQQLDLFQRVLDTGIPETCEFLGPQTAIFWRITVFKLTDCQFGVMTENITESVKAEEEIRKLESNLEAIVESTDDLIWSVDRNFRYITFNTALKNHFKNYYNINLEQGMLPTDVFPKDYADRWQGYYERVIKEGKFRVELLTLKGGTYLEVSFNPICKDGEVSEIAVFAKGVTDRKKAEEELKRMTANLQAIIESTDDHIWLVDRNYAYAFTNTSYKNHIKKYFGVDIKTGIYSKDVFSNDYAAQWDRFYERAVKEGKYRMEFLTTKGNLFLELAFNPIYKDGEVIAVSVFGKDITNYKRAEQEILKLNSELEDRVKDRTAQLQNAVSELEGFTYTVSHDLKSPLRAIDGYSRIIEDDYGEQLDTDAREMIGYIRNICRDMFSMINKLLQYSTTSRSSINKERINIAEMFGSIYSELKASHTERDIELVFKNDMPEVLADKVLLRQAIYNMLSNAVKFTQNREKTVINIGSKAAGNEHIFYVEDNGVGFDMAYAGKIFGIFQRLHGADEFEGSGIGLATVKKVIQKHGGRTWIEGNVDKGATVYFSLPSEKPVPKLAGDQNI